MTVTDTRSGGESGSPVREWVAIAAEPTVVRRSIVTALVVGVILTAINHAEIAFGGPVDARTAFQIVLTFLVPYVVSTVSSVLALARSRAAAAREIAAADRRADAAWLFPLLNPAPVLRVSADGGLMYANPTCEPLLRGLDLEIGDRLPPEATAAVQGAIARFERTSIRVEGGGRTHELRVVPVPGFGFANLYSMRSSGGDELEPTAGERVALQPMEA